jgi:hypothetical protein
MNNDKIYDVLGYLFIAGVFVALVLSITQYNTLPEVRVSNETQECVEVINHDERFDYTCEMLPSKYHHVWVQ